MVLNTTYWKESNNIQSIHMKEIYALPITSLPSVLFARLVKLRPIIYLLNRLNRVTVSPIFQQVYLNLIFLQITPYMIFTRKQVYLVTIHFTITYNLP